MRVNYCVLGTNNMAAAIEFYNALFEKTELKHLISTDRMTYWQSSNFSFALATPFDNEPATNGNGTMIGFNVDSVEKVKRLHEKAIELGGTCEGKPGQRGPYFSAYARDLDKKNCVFLPRCLFNLIPTRQYKYLSRSIVSPSVPLTVNRWVNEVSASSINFRKYRDADDVARATTRWPSN